MEETQAPPTSLPVDRSPAAAEARPDPPAQRSEASEPARAPEPRAEPESRPVRRWALVVLGICALLFVYHLFADRLTPFTTQASVNAFVVPVSPEVAGLVTESERGRQPKGRSWRGPGADRRGALSARYRRGGSDARPIRTGRGCGGSEREYCSGAAGGCARPPHAHAQAVGPCRKSRSAAGHGRGTSRSGDRCRSPGRGGRRRGGSKRGEGEGTARSARLRQS